MLLLDTVNKTTIWGGTRLQKFGADPLNTRVGSLYTVAGNEELTCTVLNGEFIGMTLHEVYAADPARFGCPQFPVFPLLIGLVDVAQDLSIQVHPGDAYARERLGAPFGKTGSSSPRPRPGPSSAAARARAARPSPQRCARARWSPCSAACPCARATTSLWRPARSTR